MSSDGSHQSGGSYYADPLEEENRTENWNNLPRASWKQVAASPLTIDLGKEVELSALLMHL